MPRSSAEDLAALRVAVIARAAGECEWPYCREAGEQMAHLEHRGMGGSVERNTIRNVAWLCRLHHDCLDGRTGLGVLRVELNELVRAHTARSGWSILPATARTETTGGDG